MEGIPTVVADNEGTAMAQGAIHAASAFHLPSCPHPGAQSG